ncbi:MAG: DUF4279 domain-containing protein [Steroidobacteraceae bacterium]
MGLDNFTVSLSVRHPSIDPGEITRALGIEPRHSWKVGERRRAGEGERVGSSYRESYWTAELRELGSLSGVETEAALLQAVVHLRRAQPFFSRLQAEGATVELLVEVTGEGEVALGLSPHLLSMLARAGFSVMLKLSPAAESARRRKAG